MMAVEAADDLERNAARPPCATQDYRVESDPSAQPLYLGGGG